MSEQSTQLFIGPAGSALEDLQPLSTQVVEGNFLYSEEEETKKSKDFGCQELSFVVEGKCEPCLPGIQNIHIFSREEKLMMDMRPRTYAATIKPEDCIRIERTDSEYAGFGNKVFFCNTEDLRLVKKREYRGCNKSKFYKQYLRKRRR